MQSLNVFLLRFLPKNELSQIYTCTSVLKFCVFVPRRNSFRYFFRLQEVGLLRVAVDDDDDDFVCGCLKPYSQQSGALCLHRASW